MKKVWNDERNALLRRLYPTAHLGSLAARLGVTKTALKSRAKVMGLKRLTGKKHPWTKRQLNYLKKHYSDTPLEVLIENTKHSMKSIYNKAHELGLYKTKAFLAHFGYRVSETEGARRNRFVKGQEPANKGKRIEEFMSAEGIERSSQTRFKKGNKPHNAREIGSECIHADGYVYLRIESGCVPKHRYVWEQVNGEVPEGYVVAFRDGDRLNCDIANLYLLSREDNARRRTLEETPEARRERVEKARITRNKSIRRDKIRLHWGMEPYGKLVKRW